MKLQKILTSVVSLIPFSVAAQSESPNIIYILADDMGYGDISALDSNSKIKTPNLDRLVNEGIKFTDAHTTSSVSTPSRYSILTGRYNWRSELQSGVLWSYSKPLIEKERPTVATMLSQNGYNTAVIGKWHLGLGWERFGSGENDVKFTKVTFSPNDNGFDYSFVMGASLDIPPYVYVKNHNFTAPVNDTIPEQGGYGFYRKGPIAEDFDINTTLERFTNEALSYIDEKSKEEKPYFLYFPLTAPHTPILPPKEFQGKSGVSPYGDFVLYVDDIVGRINEQVEKSGEQRNTIIIFTSDNGCSPAAKIDVLNSKEHYPNSIYRGTKADIFDGGHRVPFIVKWDKEIKKGSVCDKPISLISFMATCADINNISLPENYAEDSHSIYDELKGSPKKDSKGESLVVHHSIDGYFAIRKGKWKLCVCPHSGGWSSPLKKEVREDMPSMQLYDMQNDPSETTNLVTSNAKIAQELYNDLKWAIENGRTTKGNPKQNDKPIVIEKY